ncbi:MAG: hypothetical protein RR540_03300 [Oscillospiraceae bacterium]
MKKKKLFKANVAPTILFTLAVMVVISMVTAVFLSKALLNAFYSECESLDKSAENVAKIVEQDIRQRVMIFTFMQIFFQKQAKFPALSFCISLKCLNVRASFQPSQLSATTKRYFATSQNF